MEYSNCIAVFVDDYYLEYYRRTGNYECVSAVYFHSNSSCNIGGVHPDYLRRCCKRISKELAFKLHPKLKEYLEQ
jgi:hypothetical protein